VRPLAVFIFASWPGIDYTPNCIFQTCFSHFLLSPTTPAAQDGPTPAPPGTEEPGSASFHTIPQTPAGPLPAFARFASPPQPIRRAPAARDPARHLEGVTHPHGWLTCFAGWFASVPYALAFRRRPA
jgi:hypothetical protein